MIDLLLIAGGIHRDEMHKVNVLDWIKRVDKHAKRVTSVCTGAFLLANADLLDDHKAITHWEDIADLQRMFPKVKVEEDQRWINDGKYTTSAGISAGIDMSLYLVSQLHGKDLAVRVARQMEYDWVL